MVTDVSNLITRILLVLIGLALLLLGIGFWLNQPSVVIIWPWLDGRLSYIFLASILAAIGTPVIWIGLSGELAALRGGSLDFAVTYSGLSITLILVGFAVEELIPVPLFLALTLASLLFNLLLFWCSRALSIIDTRPVPGLVLGSFLVFTLLLIGVGTALILRYPSVFPWPLQPQSSVVFGWIFMGAAVYFLYGLLRPSWGNACGQLLGFLAYDLVLLVPFLRHFSAVKAEHQLSLYIYTAAIVYSAVLSLYFLFIHPTTRFGSHGKVSGMA